MATNEKNPGGRPTKLTPELQRRICHYLARGNYVETAAAACGVSKPTLYSWMKRGSEPNGPKIYREFLNAIEIAMAHAEINDLEIIERASEKNWTAAAWRLERRNPKRWGHAKRLIDDDESDIGKNDFNLNYTLD